jgi:CheY-like chemotaxis protein
MEKILIIDNDRETLNIVEQGWTRTDRYQLITASSAKKGVDLLNAQPFSVLVSGLHLPDFDGVELIAYMTRSFPSTPCIALLDAGRTPPCFMDQSDHEAVLSYIEKPVNLERLFAKIDHGIHLQQAGRTQNGMSLKHFLPLIYISGKTCRMDARYGRKEKGSLFFFRGGLVDAVLDNKIGEAAITEIIAWDSVKISIAKLPPNKKDDPVHVSLMEKIGVTWEKEKPAAEPINVVCLEEPPPTRTEERPPDPETVARVESGLKKYAGVMKSIKGYIGLAVLSSGGAIIATNTAVHMPDLTEFYIEITAILDQCDQTADRRGFQKCTGFTMHTPKGFIMMIPAAPSTDEYLHFVALMSPEANGFFMRIQLEKLIPQILG